MSAIREVTAGGATHALDTSANAAAINQALVPLGSRALVGVGPPEVQINVMERNRRRQTIRGVVEGDAVPAQFLPRLLALHEEGSLPLEKLMCTYPFEQINRAAADAAGGAAIEPVLVL